MYIIYDQKSDSTGIVNEVIFIPTVSDGARPGRDIGNKPMIYPENIPGMSSRLMINLETDELYYDYYAPETIEMKIQNLEKENADLKAQLTEAQSATLELHESQTTQDAKIVEANNATLELYELIAQGGTV
ncbi:hypothetical protein SAMN05661091_0879 [Paenibacillus uliginis N3/975]|uniref:Uncharacterized protein n=1 Tax=Paenibacillus uliginis N3/975 TaxID=1313296 RepID=A0A1X7GP52_9BACL|nr:hypothetical protein [Paenibacillus uliginis]SMF72520.1 hypothetical protein SAMN05661091_0879 [Paenibacillus uliginis N3/975]